MLKNVILLFNLSDSERSKQTSLYTTTLSHYVCKYSFLNDKYVVIIKEVKYYFSLSKDFILSNVQERKRTELIQTSP